MRKLAFMLLFITLLAACESSAKESKVIDAQSIDEIHVSTDGQNVELQPTSEEKIKIESDKLKDIKIEEKENMIMIDAGESSAGITLKTATIRIYIPERVYDKIEVKTVSGDVKAENIEAKMMQLWSDSGDMTVEDYKGEKIESTSKSGRIKLKEVDGDFEVYNDTGDVHVSMIKGINGESKVETQSGSVTISFAKEPRDIAIDFRTEAGKIKNDYELFSLQKKTDNRLEGTIGDGTSKLTVKSVTGTIQFGRR